MQDKAGGRRRVVRPGHRVALLSGVLLVWSASLLHAQGSGSVEDRLAIAEQVAQYAYRWDGKDAEGFADLFTPDGVMERQVDGHPVDGSRREGRAAILDYARTSHTGRLADRQSRHHMSALVFLELTDDHAVTENLVLITHQTAGAPPIVRSTGIYRNTWVKTDAGWRMSERILHTDRFRAP